MKPNPTSILHRAARRASLTLAVMVSSLTVMSSALADSYLQSHMTNFPPSYTNDQQSSTAGSLNDSASGTYSSSNITVNWGSISAGGAGAAPVDPNLQAGFSMNPIGSSIPTIVIHNPAYVGSGGMIRLKFHLSGNFSASAGGTAYASSSYAINIGPFQFGGRQQSDGQLVGAAPETLRTFTVDRFFGFDQPYEVQMNLNVNNSGNGRPDGGSSASSNFTLTFGGFEIMDNQGNPINDYTATGTNGSALSTAVSQGQTYDGFTVTNTGPYSSGTTFQLLGGTASGPSAVSVMFTGGGTPSGPQPVSDAAAFSGTGSTPVVIQMDYPAAAAPFKRGEQAPGFRLAWLNPATGEWTNAVGGNTGGTPHFFQRAYNPATDFAVGNYGLDPATHRVWAVVNHNSLFAVAAVPDALAASSLVSRKTHGSAGTFDIPLNLTGTPSVECRSSGGNHTLVFTFNNALASGNAEITSGVGTIASAPTISGTTMTIPLTGVTNAQRLTVTLRNVTDTNSQVLPDTAFTVGFLVGDTNGNGSVTATDVAQTKAQSGQPVTATNFRSDVNISGTMTASDVALVKSTAGTLLPP